MKETTKQLVVIALSQDESIADEVRNQIVQMMEGNIPLCQQKQKPFDRILSRAQVAAIFGCRPECVDYYGRMGYIRRISITGKDAQGYSEQSVREALKRKSTIRTKPRDPRLAREAQRRKREARGI